MDLVSIIIPTYNRFNYLLNTIKSIKAQTYKNIEIIVINDCSTQKEYYEYNWNDVKILHLTNNTKSIFGFACAGYVRNFGIMISNGKYIGFCDDDDIWLPNKLVLQLNAMKESNCKISSTDGFIGHGPYNHNNKYELFNKEKHYRCIKDIYVSKGSNVLNNGFPKIWDLNFLKINNSVICSSVLIESDILNKIGNFENYPNGDEDYDCWLRALDHTNLVYVEDPCFYYDAAHGDGRNY